MYTDATPPKPLTIAQKAVLWAALCYAESMKKNGLTGEPPDLQNSKTTWRTQVKKLMRSSHHRMVIGELVDYMAVTDVTLSLDELVATVDELDTLGWCQRHPDLTPEQQAESDVFTAEMLKQAGLDPNSEPPRDKRLNICIDFPRLLLLTKNPFPNLEMGGE